MTSQIFANIYLNDFDRFVRHDIKPLAYLRYGDDFILFTQTQQQAMGVQRNATEWLKDNLNLQVHVRNNIVLRASKGLSFLGHQVHPLTTLSVDRYMTNKIMTELDANNYASYRAMNIPRRKLKLLPWLLRGK